MPTPQEFKQLLISKYPQGVASDGRRYADIPDAELTSMVVNKFPQGVTNSGIRYADFLPTGATDASRPGFLAAPETPKTRNMAQMQADAEQKRKEAERMANPFRLGWETAKGVGREIAASEVGLANTIAQSIGGLGQQAASSIAGLSESQSQLLQRIREKKAKGEDITKLVQVFNDNQKVIGGQMLNLEEETALPTNLQALGQIGGTALDILTFGTYGKAAQGMKSFSLSKSASNLGKTIATGAGLPELGKIAEQKAGGLLTKQGAKNIATGAGIGYASDVTYGLQGFRGEDRTGAKALIPGLGTVIGTTIPAISEAGQSIKNLKDPGRAEQHIIHIAKKYDDALNLNKTQRAIETRSGKSVSRLLAEEGIPLRAEKGRLTAESVDEAVNALEDTMRYEAPLFKRIIKDSGAYVNLDEARNAAISKLNKGDPGYSLAKRHVENVFKDIEVKYGKNMVKNAGGQRIIPAEIADELKSGFWKAGKFNAFATPQVQTQAGASRTVGNALMKGIENSIDDANIRMFNARMGDIQNAIYMLGERKGMPVKGGRLGKYFARTIGAVVGAKGGPFGSIAGAMTADKIADFISNPSNSTWTRRALLQKLRSEGNDTLIRQAEQILEKRANLRTTVPKLPAPNTIQAGFSPDMGGMKSQVEAQELLRGLGVKGAGPFTKIVPENLTPGSFTVPFKKPLNLRKGPPTLNLGGRSKTVKIPVSVGKARIGTILGVAGASAFGIGAKLGLDKLATKETIVPGFGSKPQQGPPSPFTVAGVDLKGYATNPSHISEIKDIYGKTGPVNSPHRMQMEIDRLMDVADKTGKTKTEITGQMITEAATEYGIDPKLLLALLRVETSLGLNLKSKNNPGNIGNDDEGNTRDFETMKEGVLAAAEALAKRKNPGF